MKTFFKKYNPIVLMDPKMLPELDFLSEYPELCFDNGNIVFVDKSDRGYELFVSGDDYSNYENNFYFIIMLFYL